MTVRLVDTNIIIRAVTGNPPEQAELLPPIFTAAGNGEFNLFVPSVVVAESIYVLQNPHFGFTRPQIAYALRAFFTLPGVVLEEPGIIFGALTAYEQTNVDIQDAYLACKANLSGDSVLTWNVKDFKKLGCDYIEP